MSSEIAAELRTEDLAMLRDAVVQAATRWRSPRRHVGKHLSASRRLALSAGQLPSYAGHDESDEREGAVRLVMDFEIAVWRAAKSGEASAGELVKP